MAGKFTPEDSAFSALDEGEGALFSAVASPARKSSPVQSYKHQAPLAVRMRPRGLDEIVGQQHLLGSGSPLRQLIEQGNTSTSPSSIILFGPPGTGKTTLAYAIAQSSERNFVELSAVLAGVKDVREVVDRARAELKAGGKETVLFVDEVHRFSKSQQDALLPSVENRWVTLIAATTENPHFSVISPLLSRSLLLRLESLANADLEVLIDRALTSDRGLKNAVTLSMPAKNMLLRLAGGDARKVLTSLEAAAGVAISAGLTEIDEAVLSRALDQAVLRYDRSGDEHYDVTSAFIKSMRGSDVDAALHYLARMIEAGEDPRFIARRIMICASEDVGMADPTALTTAVAAAQMVQLVGMPEGRIPLAQAVVHIATAPKSNASYQAINRAIADVRAGNFGAVPPALRDAHYAGAESLGHGKGYIYSHDEPRGVAKQQYPPDELVGVDYYEPTSFGAEAQVKRRLEILRNMIRE